MSILWACIRRIDKSPRNGATEMRIYWIRAQAPRKVLALARYLGIDAEFIEARGGMLKTPDYARLNPNLKAPVLVDGDVVVWESTAIMAYLCIKAGSDLWPSRVPADQVQVLCWLGWNDCHWAPAVGTHYFEHIIKATFGLGSPDREALESALDDLARYAKVLDAHLAGHDYIACERLTIADFSLAAMAASWREAEMPLQPYRNVLRWLERLQRIPAWADPWPAGA
jgi:glutathione S-transferase